MGFFSFIENFFFLSLAITFVLILLLVYHFKQRITSLEQKNDTMFEIANGLVKEVGAMKSYLMSTMSSQFINPFNHVSLHKIDDDIEEEDDAEDDDDDDTEDDDDAEEEEDDAEEEEDDAEEEEDDAEEDNAEDDDEEYEIVYEEVVTAEENNDLVNDIDTAVIEEEELKVVEVSLDEKDKEALDIKESEVIVNKVEITSSSTVDDSLTEQTAKTDKDSYKKMNVNQLKAFIIEKGYTTDFKNLKRNDLIKIIEDNETK